MPDIQRELFIWVSHQHCTIGLVLLALGLVYAFIGFRFYTFLVAVTCGALGFVAGAITGTVVEIDPILLGGVCGAAGLGVTPLNRKTGEILAGATTWAAFGGYLLHQLGMEPPTLFVAMLVSGVLGATFVCVCRNAPRAVISTLQGVALIVVGAVGASRGIMPSLGETFVDWAAGWSMLVPMIMLMLFVTGYSFQSMHMRGDITTGST